MDTADLSIPWNPQPCVLNTFQTTNYAVKYSILVLWATWIIWVRSRNCGLLVTWFCSQLIAKPGNKTATVSWPDPYKDLWKKKHFQIVLNYVFHAMTSLKSVFLSEIYSVFLHQGWIKLGDTRWVKRLDEIWKCRNRRYYRCMGLNDQPPVYQLPVTPFTNMD